MLDLLMFLWYHNPMNIDEKRAEYSDDFVVVKASDFAAMEAKIASLEALNKHYEELLKLAKADKFGKSSEKSETFEPMEQLGLFDEAENTADKKAPEPEFETVVEHKRRKHTGKRDEDLEGLPVEKVLHELSDEQKVCPECGDLMTVFEELVGKRLKVIPAQFIVQEIYREVAACRNCEKTSDHTPMLKADMPVPVIIGSVATPSLVAHIMCLKYVNANPLYRIESDMLRNDIVLSRQTMSNWMIKCAYDWLTPLYDRLRTFLLQEDILHADETRLEVLHEPGRKANTNSFMWLYRTSGQSKHTIVLYEYTQTRAASNPKRFLDGFSGYLCCDGYQAYHTLPDVTVVGCFYHGRRNFFDVFKTLPESERQTHPVNTAIEHFKKLAKLEEQYESLSNAERYQKRLDESKPIAEELIDWASKLRVLPQSGLGKACTYMVNQKPWLMNVYLDGRLEISNNRAERSIKPFVTGRKNWLFSNTPRGATASSVIYSIIETAKENELKPFQYLEFLFDRLPNCTTSQIDDLLPWSPSLPEFIRNKKPILPRAIRS
jgi:transposase